MVIFRFFFVFTVFVLCVLVVSFARSFVRFVPFILFLLLSKEANTDGLSRRVERTLARTYVGAPRRPL